MNTIDTDSRVKTNELVEKRRRNLLERINAARLQLDSLSSFQSSYEKCRESLFEWRSKMLEELNRTHQESLNELNQTYEQLGRIRLTKSMHPCADNHANEKFDIESNLKTIQNSQFNFSFNQNDLFEVNGELLKVFNYAAICRHQFNKSTTLCRLLVQRTKYLSDFSVYDQLITRIDHQVPECVLVCPFDLLNELIANENEIRLLIDQNYLTAIRSQIQRMIIDYDLIHIQVGQEACPQSTEFVIKLISHDPIKLFICIEEIYAICSRQEKPNQFCEYTPLNYNRTRIHLYGGYTNLPVINSSSISNDNETNKVHKKSPPSLIEKMPNRSSSNSLGLLSLIPTENHFDRVLMPVSVRQTFRITDTQAGALLGPKGERIQQLQRETGAIVTIGDLNEYHDRRKRIVYIQGSEQQVNKAQIAIQKLLTSSGYNGDDDLEKQKKSF